MANLNCDDIKNINFLIIKFFNKITILYIFIEFKRDSRSKAKIMNNELMITLSIKGRKESIVLKGRYKRICKLKGRYKRICILKL